MVVEEIIANYNHSNTGVRGNLRRLLNHGALGGSGKLLILPVDQGFEHGPDKSFAENDDAYDPKYHAELAYQAKLSAFASSLGMIEAVAHEYAGAIPLILKLNHSNSLISELEEPMQSPAALVSTALQLGCSGVGFTIYPGSANLPDMMNELRNVTQEAKALGLFVVVWSYPRGGTLSKEDETALDVISYSAHMAASLGADIIKVKFPTSYVRDKALADKYKANNWNINDDATRIQIVKRACFNGKRMVLFSGGQKKSDSGLLEEVTAIKRGGGTGSIIGRNAFQRKKGEALALLQSVINIYKSDI